MTTVAYHVDHEGREYALSYVHETDAAAREDCASRSELAIVRPIDLDQQYFGVYTASSIEATSAAAIDYSDLDAEDTYIAESVVGIFDWIDDEQDLVWYKPIEPEAIVDAIDRVQWCQSVPDVGAQLLSNLILAHGLPNANHRTSIAFLNLYLSTMDPSFDPPATTTPSNEWVDWVDDYIVESKRLLTLTMNARLFEWLEQRGATVIDRKDDIQISFPDYDLAVDDPWAAFSAAHERRSRAFVEEYIRRAGHDGLLTMQDDGKDPFETRL